MIVVASAGWLEIGPIAAVHVRVRRPAEYRVAAVEDMYAVNGIESDDTEPSSIALAL